MFDMEMLFSLAPLLGGMWARNEARDRAGQYPLRNPYDFWTSQEPQGTGRPGRETGPDPRNISVPREFSQQTDLPTRITGPNFLNTWFGQGFRDASNIYDAEVRQNDRQMEEVEGLRGDTREILSEGRQQIQNVGAAYGQAAGQLAQAQGPVNAFVKYAQQLPNAIKGELNKATAQVMALRNDSVDALRDGFGTLVSRIAPMMDSARQAIDAQVKNHESELERQASEAGYTSEELDIAKNGLKYAAGSLLLGQFGGMVAQVSDFLGQGVRQLAGDIAKTNTETANILSNLGQAAAEGLARAGEVQSMATTLSNNLAAERARVSTERAVVQSGLWQAVRSMHHMGLSETARLMWDFQEPVLAAAPLMGQIFSVFNSLLTAGNQTNMNQQALYASFDQLLLQGLNSTSSQLVALGEADEQRRHEQSMADQAFWGNIAGGGMSMFGSIGGGLASNPNLFKGPTVATV